MSRMNPGKERKSRTRDGIEIIDLDGPEERGSRSAGKQRQRRSAGQHTEHSRRQAGQDHRPRTEKRNPGKRTSTKSGRNLEFLIITYLFLALFLGMIVYLVVFQVFQSGKVISDSHNPRLDLYEQRVIRGDILSSDDVVLATSSVNEDGSQTRDYPYGRMFAHVVGYVNNGKGGLESDYNFNLLQSHSFFLTQLINDLRDQKSQGDSVVTTLNYEVQEAAYNALGSDDGAVVVLEPDTGKILAMVSKPDYDPNTLADNWESIVTDDSSSVLLNRATAGLYPPGSTFKIFTALEYIHENPDYENYSFDCEGELTVDGNQIHCYHNSVHGQQNLIQSFANSCNTSFANIGLTLDISRFTDLLESMMFNQSLPGNVSGTSSRFTLTEDEGTGKIMQTAIGQGDTLVSPLHMALVAAAVDNDGVVMTPYLVDHTENDTGKTVRRFRSSEYGQIMSEEDAAILQELMGDVVAEGTATALSGQSYSAAGKTGSAEYDSQGNSHGWFVGYASKEGYNDIAIAVIVEDGDSGSRSAVPVAKAVFDTWFN